jgi:hypothetical protein
MRSIADITASRFHHRRREALEGVGELIWTPHHGNDARLPHPANDKV